MSKLLSANLARLWKSKVFWLGAAFMLALAVYIMLSTALSYPPQNNESFDTLYFGYSQILGFCCAVFTSLFLGTEYSDGTIRNKIIVGHSRPRIYLANLATVFTAMLFMMAAWLVGALVGFPFFGPLENPAGCLVNFIAGVFTTAAFSAIFTFIAMLCSSKTLSAVISIISFLGLSVLASNIGYEPVRDFLPTGQAIWVAGAPVNNSILALLGSVLVTISGSVLIAAAITRIGIFMFQNKDLK